MEKFSNLDFPNPALDFPNNTVKDMVSEMPDVLTRQAKCSSFGVRRQAVFRATPLLGR